MEVNSFIFHIALCRPAKMGLDALCKRYLGVQMDKSWRVRCSNWEAYSLSDRQIEYAAHDAIVAVHIFFTLTKLKQYDKGRELPLMDSQGRNDDNKENTHCTENLCFDSEEGSKMTLSLNKYEVEPKKGYVIGVVDMLSDSVFDQRAISLCKGIVDLGFKNKFMKNPSIKSEGFLNKGSKKPYKTGKTQRKSPLYTNCQLVAPDGARLCILDRKKAEWYIHKEIGNFILESSIIVPFRVFPAPSRKAAMHLHQNSINLLFCIYTLRWRGTMLLLARGLHSQSPSPKCI